MNKTRFVKELAIFLAGNQAGKSIHLQMGKSWAQEWAALRSASPLFGYPTIEEAEKQLSNWLGIPTVTVIAARENKR